MKLVSASSSWSSSGRDGVELADDGKKTEWSSSAFLVLDVSSLIKFPLLLNAEQGLLIVGVLRRRNGERNRLWFRFRLGSKYNKVSNMGLLH
jgi:hypothetical protein